MKENFFKKNKKKSALLLLLLFLKGRGKYLAIFLLAVLASAPFVVTSDSFKAFTNHPAVAAVLQSFGFTGAAFADKDMIAQAAHNKSGKKSSYWLNYFKKINAPLPTGKFSSMKFLDGNIKDLEPVKIADKTKNKYGIKGVVNEANYSDGTGEISGVDLSSLVPSDMTDPTASAGAFKGNLASMDSISTSLELGSKSAFGPYIGKNTFAGNGTVLDKKDAMSDKVGESISSEVPEAPRVQGEKPSRKSYNGRVSAFSWSKSSRGKRATAFAGGTKGSFGVRSSIKEAYGYSMSAAEMQNTAESDTIAGAAFDGNPVGGDVLDTGEPVSVGSGSYAAYVAGATDSLQGMEECGQAMQEANDKASALFEENKRISEDMGCKCRNCCGPWSGQKRRKRNWNNHVSEMQGNCLKAQEAFLETNTESCKGKIPITDQECETFEEMDVHCSFWNNFTGFFGADSTGRCSDSDTASAKTIEDYDPEEQDFINRLRNAKDRDEAQKILNREKAKHSDDESLNDEYWSQYTQYFPED